MDSRTTVPWWQRLLLGFAATVSTVLVAAAVFAAQSFWRGPGLHWFSWSGGGGIQIPAFILYAGGLIALAMYIVVVVPLVLIWPVRSQLKHWYAFLCVAEALPIGIFSRPWIHPVHNPHDILFEAEHLWITILPVLFGSVCYLLLLRRQQTRFNSTL